MSGPESDGGMHGKQAPAWSQQRQLRVLGIAGAILVAAVLLIWLGIHLFTPPPPAEEAPPPVGSFRPTPEQLKTLTIAAVGERQFQGIEVTDGSIALNGDLTTPVFSPYSGRVTRVIAKPGDVLRKGAPLATIDASEFVQAQNDLVAALAAEKLARTSETRKHGLYDAQGGSLQDWQQAQADLATAQVALQAVRNRLKILGKSEADIEALQSAGRVDATVDLPAPIDGVVVDREVGPGQYVQAGAGTPIFTLADVSSVWLVANVREEDAPLIHKGQPVEVRVAAFPSRIFKARVTYISATVDPNTHRLPVRAEIANADGALKPQMFATFSIITSDGMQSPFVPEGAVVYDGSQARVYVVQSDARDSKKSLISIRPITVGLTEGRDVQVLEGLKSGERVVTRGSLFIDRAVTGD
jgi:membrane fusion protein, heavy metal efflux system